MVDAFCVRCKDKREIVEPTESLTSRGVKILKGKCSVCGTKMCRMMGK